MKRGSKEHLKLYLFHLLMFFGAFLTILPFIWMLGASLMHNGQASVFPPRFIPPHATLFQYITLFKSMNLGRYFFNSFVIALSVTGVSLLFNSLAGFAFAKYTFRGQKVIFSVLISSMIIPGQVTMLPVFLLLNKLGLLNTYFGIIFPAMASVFGIFLFRQYLLGIPDSLIDAARIDGAGDFLIYRKIILPLSAPILVTLALFTFMGTWNDFLWPLIVMTDDTMYTLPVAIASLSQEYIRNVELMMAGSVITIVPIVIVFMALQKYYLKGIFVGGIKE